MSDKKETFLRISVLALASAVVLSLLASSNTLLFQQYRFDYAAFRIIGEGWAAGHVPFRDFFDHKGPLLFFIQMAAALVSKSKAVIWILEVACMALTLEMLFRCGRYIGASRCLNYLSMAVALTVYACYVDGGNTVEVWSLPFEVLPLLLLLRHFSGRTKLPTVALVGGLCFGLVTMMRINNNAMITGLVIGMVISLCLRREYGAVLRCAGWFMCGLAIGILPFVVYFLGEGAFDDFIYCTFTFSMRYVGITDMTPMEALGHNSKLLFPCLIILPILALYSKKRGIGLPLILAPMTVIVFLTFCFGRSYPHYFLMTLPVAVLSIQLLWPFDRYVKGVGIILYLLSSVYILRTLVPYRIKELIKIRKNEVVAQGMCGQKFISDFIPDEDKGSIYTYGELYPAVALDANGYLPVGKYFFFQNTHQLVDKKVQDDMVEKFREANPKWIISTFEDMGVLNEILSGYEKVPIDSLPDSCPGFWHVYSRKQ